MSNVAYIAPRKPAEAERTKLRHWAYAYAFMTLWWAIYFIIWSLIDLYLICTDDERTLYHRGVTSRPAEIIVTVLGLASLIGTVYLLTTAYWMFGIATGTFYMWLYFMIRHNPENNEW